MTETSKSVHLPRSRLGAALSALAAVAILASPVLAQDEVLPGEPNPPWDDGALPAEVIPGLDNVRPVTWDRILVAPDGRTASVYFWNGLPECKGLADVQVEERTDGIAIELWVGDVPGAEVCAEVAQLYRVVVVFDERVFTGGSILDLKSG